MLHSRIKQNELHIWRANLREFDLALPVLWSVLSGCERANAETCRFIRDKENYIIRHGVLRLLLASYALQPPSSLSFTTGGEGKPELRTATAGSEIYFNMSYSRDVAVYGITGSCPVGVDVECLQSIPQCERVAREFFSQAEFENLMGLPRELRAKRFIDIWTRKEALLKATGVGLAGGRMKCYATQAEPVNANRENLAEAFYISSGWYVRSFSPFPGYEAAVAYRNADLELVCRGTPAFFREMGNVHTPGRSENKVVNSFS